MTSIPQLENRGKWREGKSEVARKRGKKGKLNKIGSWFLYRGKERQNGGRLSSVTTLQRQQVGGRTVPFSSKSGGIGGEGKRSKEGCELRRWERVVYTKPSLLARKGIKRAEEWSLGGLSYFTESPQRGAQWGQKS